MRISSWQVRGIFMAVNLYLSFPSPSSSYAVITMCASKRNLCNNLFSLSQRSRLSFLFTLETTVKLHYTRVNLKAQRGAATVTWAEQTEVLFTNQLSITSCSHLFYSAPKKDECMDYAICWKSAAPDRIVNIICNLPPKKTTATWF